LLFFVINKSPSAGLLVAEPGSDLCALAGLFVSRDARSDLCVELLNGWDPGSVLWLRGWNPGSDLCARLLARRYPDSDLCADLLRGLEPGSDLRYGYPCVKVKGDH
jgi:hypothetical protein